MGQSCCPGSSMWQNGTPNPRLALCSRCPPAGRGLRDVPPIAAPRCPADHLLQTFAVPHGGFMCDKCSQAVAVGAPLNCCRVCDYQACSSCCASAETHGTAALLRAISRRSVCEAATCIDMMEPLRRSKSEAETVPPKKSEAETALREDLLALLQIGKSCDLVIKSGDEEVRCHRAIMQARVPQLRELIASLPVETLEIEMPADFPDGLWHIVEHVYSGDEGPLPGIFADVRPGLSGLAADMCGLLDAEGGDCKLVCGEGASQWVAVAHVAMLQARSEYFRSMTLGEFKEAQAYDAAGSRLVPIHPSIGMGTMTAILVALYTDSWQDGASTPEEIVDVWQVADYLNLPTVAALAEFQLAESVDWDNCLRVMAWAEDHGIDYVRRMTYRFLRKEFGYLATQRKDVIAGLSPMSLRDLLLEDALGISDEAVVLQAVLHWAQAAAAGAVPSRSFAVLPELLRAVRLAILDPGDSGDYAGALPDAEQRALFVCAMETMPEHRSECRRLWADGGAREAAMASGNKSVLPRLTRENKELIRQDAARRCEERERLTVPHTFSSVAGGQ